MLDKLTIQKREKLLSLAQSSNLKKKIVDLPSIERVDRCQRLPLSYAQQRLWFIDRMQGTSTEYNMPWALRLRGKLDQDALHRAIKTIVQRHESLRTHVGEVEGEAVQVIEAEMQVEIPVVDLSGLEKEKREEAVRRAMREEAEGAFDLARGPVLRIKLLKLEEEEHILLLTMHHIVSDGWSMGVMNRELGILYGAYREGRENPLKPLEVQYADFAMWQRKWLSEGAMEEGLKYWKETLAGMEWELELPKDRARPTRLTFGAESCEVRIPPSLAVLAKRLGEKNGATLYMTLLGVLGVLLARYSGQEDIVVGSPIANRQDAQLEGLIGFFLNTLVLRMRVRGEKSFGELLKQVRRTTLDAYRYQDVPFERLVEMLAPERHLNRTPIAQVTLTMQNTPWQALHLDGLELEEIAPDELQVREDLQMHVREEDGKGIAIWWLYNRDLFDRWRMEQMAGHYLVLLQAVTEDERRRVDSLPLLREAERRQVLYEWNATGAEYPREKCVHELFEEQVERTPDAVAVEYEGERLTYGELNRRANQLGHYLCKLGVRAETRVAICVERSLEMVVGVLGVLKAGGAYVPLDPGYPEERLRFMLKDSAPTVLLIQGRLAELSTGFNDGVRVVDVSEDAPAWDAEAEGNLDPSAIGLSGRHAAYVIYTSGSTGLPKGVVIEHCGVCNMVIAQTERFTVTAESRILQFASFSFDASVWEMFMALCRGASLYPAPSREKLTSEALVELVAQRGITHATLPPALLSSLPEEAELESIGMLIVAGEALTETLARRWGGGRKLINAYGPTEASVCATMHEWRSEEMGSPSIGRPIANVRVYILDKQGEPVPMGVVGEIYIGGAGVVRGYMNRPELTAERFMADPFTEAAGMRMYKTGDLGRWMPNGTIEFVGRNDAQVKIRGYRIELGEIEARLIDHPGVRGAVVLAREDVPGEKRLVAYYTVAEGKITGAETLRMHLEAMLPEYMVPAAYVTLQKLPLTANGKADRNALPPPEGDANARGGYEAPQGQTERVLAKIWEELLQVERVGRKDNFFQLGGHSLLAISLVSHVRAGLGLEMEVATVFESPTVEGLSTRLQKGRVRRVERQSRPERLPLSYAQQRLWFLHRLQGGRSTEYNQPQAQRLHGELDVDAMRRAVQTIVERHESLRTYFGEMEGEPVQVIEREVEIAIPEEDLQGLSEEEQKEQVSAALREEGGKAFDLERGPVLRMKLLKLAEQEHVLLRTTHHVVSDGWSEGVFNREFAMLYEAYRQGRENPLDPLPVQYADFALWQRKWLSEGALEEGLKYWKEELAGIEGELELPRDRPRPLRQTFGADWCVARIPPERTALAKRLGERNGATLYMTLLGVFGVLLSRYSRQEDIVVGSPIANRQDAVLEGLVGFFVNSLVMRLRMKGDETFRELLEEVRRVALGAYRHQDVPFERVVEELSPERSLNVTPLFQVTFAVQNAPSAAPDLAGLKVGPVLSEEAQVRCDLEVHVQEEDREGIAISWLYNRDLFDRWRMEQMVRHYLLLLQAVTEDESRRLDSLPMIGEQERRQVLFGWNATWAEYPWEKCVHELFEEQVERTPEAVAVEYEGEGVTYRELNRRANQLGHYLRKLGVKPERRVAICMERSVEMVLGLLGVLKAGGAYVPLEPSYPKERLQFMLEDSRPAILLTQSHLRNLFGTMENAAPAQLELMDGDAWEGEPETNLERVLVGLTSQHLSYVIYTSGSTGRPKGVMVEHAALVNKIHTLREYLGISKQTRYGVVSSIGFDPILEQLLCPLSSGGTAVLFPNETRRDLHHLIYQLRRYSLSVLNVSPALLRSFLSEWDSAFAVETLIVGADVLPCNIANDLNKAQLARRVLNFYGPTETCVDATAYEVERRTFTTQVPIGRPLKNYHIYVLDDGLQPVPVGVTGELYIGGAGVARGYLGSPGRTGERFVADPYGKAGSRMYRSGDTGMWLPDGTIEFMGRNDGQVKIRGYRIEVGEIEARLGGHPRVRETVVMVREDVAGEKRLVAYYTATAESIAGETIAESRGSARKSTVAADELRRYLGERLPEYMVPAMYVVLEKMPLTANGKVDRKKLPAPEGNVYARGGYEAPEGEPERALGKIWEELLHVERVGRQDNFFELGGHSLLALSLINRVRSVLGIELPIRTIFEYSTLAGLSRHLWMGSKGREELRVQERPELVPLSYAQQRLWFLHRLQDGRSTEYNQPQAQRLCGELDVEALQRAVQTIVERHESLRTHFTEMEGEPVQVIEREVEISIAEQDLQGLSEAEQKERVSAALREEGRKPFDLERGPVLRMKLLKLGEQEHVLLRTTHHIVSDGWSEGVFNREFEVLYKAYREGRENPLEPLPVQYADFALWQRRWLDGGVMAEGLEYWKGRLAGIVERLELPLDRARPIVPTYLGGACQVVLTHEQAEGVKRVSQETQVTLYMLLLAGLGVLLARYSGQEDILVGSPIANRQDAQLEGLIGFFVNTLVLRMSVSEDKSFREFLEEVRQTTLDAYRYQDVPFERLIELLSPERRLNGTPLCQVALTMHNTPWVAPRLGGLVLEGVAGDEFQVRFDLTVHAWEAEGKIGFSWLYNKDVFAAWRIEQMARHYVRVLETVIENAQQSLSNIRLLTSREREDLIGKQRREESIGSVNRSSVLKAKNNYRFSKGAWLKAHPDGDIARATQAAIAHGLEIVE